MATITEDYVSFETAKLLKEKGFDIPVKRGVSVNRLNLILEEPKNMNGELSAYYSQPTQQMAMRWLREVHHIHIIAEPCLGEGNEPNLSFNRWFWTILKEEGEYKPIRKIDEFLTYEEACKAGIKYCLENLI